MINDVTSAGEDSMRNEAHKECAEDEMVTKDVTPVCDDGKRSKAHKKRAEKTAPTIISPVRYPNNLEKRKMIGKMIEIMALAGMENHVYKFENIIRKQRSGGPIGLSLTGDIADCYLIGWDKKFKEKLRTLGINEILYDRYKDDITIMTESLEKGSKYENDKVIVDLEKKNTDADKTDGEISMEVIVEVAQSIDGMIKFTYDIPENYKHGKLPVLDVEINVNKLERNRIGFEFFEKPTRNKRVMLEDAAIPPNQKRTILTQECLRRLRNTKYELGEEVRIKHLNNFMLKLKNSGYGTKYRTEILDSALIAYEKIISEDRAGIKPLYRSRDYNKEERDQNKINRNLIGIKTAPMISSTNLYCLYLSPKEENWQKS